MTDDTARRRQGAAKVREDLGDRRFRVRQGGCDGGAAELWPVRALFMLANERPHLIDGRDAAQITLVRRAPPCEQPVAAENDAIAARLVAATTSLSISASSKPGRCHGSHAIRRPYCALNSSSFAAPFALAASAIAQSGWRWSTCGNGRNACSGVSIDAATRFSPNAQSG